MPLRIVSLAIVPDQLDVVQHLLNSAVLPRFEFVLHFEQIHRVLDDQRVVIEFEFWVRKRYIPSRRGG